MKAIEIKNISKTYSGKKRKANNNICLDLYKGEILCIAGENGAGKTTLMKILSGILRQDTGEIIKNGNIGMVHQHFMLFGDYTAAENIVMGREPRKAGIFFNKKKAVSVSQKIISENNFSIKANTKVNEMTLGEMQQVEICRILYRNADIIILDEPTSILTEVECQSLFKNLKNLANNGKSIILITHKLYEITLIGDRIAVLRRGELIGIRDVKKVNIEEIALMMTGDVKSNVILSGLNNQNKINNIQVDNNEINEDKYFSDDDYCENKESVPVISFENVYVTRRGQKRPLLENVSFSVSSGEILGFAGVGGNGLGVIEAVLGGFLHAESGKIFHRDRDITKLNIQKLRKQGLAFVPADRLRVGSALEATIEENMIINKRDWIGKNRNLIRRIIMNQITKFNIDAPDMKEKASALSGGNLQKLILARETSRIKDYIVFSEPTWGLDFKAGQFVLNEIKEIRKNGTAVILISTDLDELISLADRIIVMYRGKIAGVHINNGDIPIKEKISRNMQGIVSEEFKILNNE